VGQAGLQVLYSPDRLKIPLKRSGERGQGKWESISWEEAIKTIAQKLRELREKGETHKVAFLVGKFQGVLPDFIHRFLTAYGSPNYLKPGQSGADQAYRLSQGAEKSLSFDLENANYILSFGTNLLEAWWSPVLAHRTYQLWRQRGKTKFVQVEPRFSITAAKADEWIPLNPGTEGVLALGIGYVLLEENLLQQNFIEEHTLGFENWIDKNGKSNPGFKTFLEQYHLDMVSTLTGVSVETIVRLAKEFGTRKPALALADLGPDEVSLGTFHHLAIHVLNALVGSIDQPGGVLKQGEIPYQLWKPVIFDEKAKNGMSKPGFSSQKSQKALLQALIEEKPYPLELLFVYGSNPAFSNPQDFKELLKKVPFLVSFSSFLDETAENSDLVLPEPTYLEKWDGLSLGSFFPYPTFSLIQPLIGPLYEIRQTGDILLQLTKELKGTVTESFPWLNFEEALKERVKGIYEAQRGTLFTTPFQTSQIQVLQGRGWWIPTYTTFEEFWTQLVERGGWWDPSYRFEEWERIFKTPSGRFEFSSHVLRNELSNQAFPESLPEERKGEFPFKVSIYRPSTLLGEVSANLPHLQEIVGTRVNQRWDSWAEIHPETAKALGIQENDWVWIETSEGKLKTLAKLFRGARPGMVNLVFGLGHHSLGRYAQGRGINPQEILTNQVEGLSGFLLKDGALAKIYKA